MGMSTKRRTGVYQLIQCLTQYTVHTVYSVRQNRLVGIYAGESRTGEQPAYRLFNTTHRDRDWEIIRRLIADLVVCYNMLHGFPSMNINSFFTLSKNTSLRGQDSRFQIPRSKLNVRKFVFAHRLIQAWNSLPHQLSQLTTRLLLNRI